MVEKLSYQAILINCFRSLYYEMKESFVILKATVWKCFWYPGALVVSGHKTSKTEVKLACAKIWVFALEM